MGAERYVHTVSPDPKNRDDNDFYPTPATATVSLLMLEKFSDHVWEPACGDGAISQVLEWHGHKVVSTDLVDRGYGQGRVDFLMERRLLAPQIITNPPFKNAKQFVRHALDLGAEKVAMLLRLAWLEGVDRKRLFQSTPLARVHVSSRRLTFSRGEQNDVGLGGGGMIAFAWFVWERDWCAAPELNFFDWADFLPPETAEKMLPTAAAMPLFE